MSLKSVNKIETNKVELEIEVSAEDFEKAVQTVYLKTRNRIAIPGFRKGKAPRKVIEKEYGEGFFYEDAVNVAADSAVPAAIREAALEIVGRPELDVESLSKENGVVYKLTCVVKPEVTIDGYKGIEVERVVDAVTDEEVDKRANLLCERNSRLVTVDDRSAQIGDTVKIDFKGFKDDVAFEGGEAEDFELELGSGQFIPGFEDQIVGRNSGEEFEINVTFPDDYQVDDLKGAPAVFKIKLHEIKLKEVPALDDDLIKDSTEFETVDEYKNDLRKKMEEAAEKKADAEVENKLFDIVMEKMQAEVPEVMYDERVNEMLQDLRSRVEPQGITIEQYFKYIGQSLESAKRTYEEQAKKQVDLRLALEQIVKNENIDATDDEVEAEYKRLADTYHVDLDRVKRSLDSSAVKMDVLVGKAVQLIKDTAVIK
ncbi:MAG: trigger factor [Ruminococcus sp.]|nr:trigger factor [Ruminococcus sp.]